MQRVNEFAEGTLFMTDCGLGSLLGRKVRYLIHLHDEAIGPCE
jgi:hypothetical protein